MIQKGRIFLFPCPIFEGKTESLSAESIKWLHETTTFVVEKAKTARHFIKSTQHPVPIALMQILEITENKKELNEFLQVVHQGTNIGVISEAGCPGVADPGAEVVEWAHLHGIKVVPFVGPSSILLALMASGFNGQNFVFNGYLSNKKPELITQIKTLEQKVQKTGQTQIFMETPYRNAFIIETCLDTLNEQTRLCIACDINAPDEDIRQMRVVEWKKAIKGEYHKRPCIYLIGK
ncbi:MAG: SAM-dependent methyltransferase [Saprospiraceae bacterium]|nr:SAM-dependent methyltransferase [Saprospiraceae bacterium]MBP9196648.1 SAM-dependent methyltransferase [Saprospiraceae bacterium]